MESIPVAVVGAGIIGRTHIDTLAQAGGIHLCAIVDPIPTSAEIAEKHGVPFFGDIEALIGSGAAKGAIVASPNHTHVEIATRLLDAGLAVLLEKPVSTTVTEGLELDMAVKAAAAPLLVGHHRRHNPIIKAAKKAISEGVIGELVTANVNVTLTKPPAYFDVAWRKQPGQGGPLLINLIHEIDLLRHFFGEVKAVTAITSNVRRRFEVEDTAALLRLKSVVGGGTTRALVNIEGVLLAVGDTFDIARTDLEFSVVSTARRSVVLGCYNAELDCWHEATLVMGSGE